VRRKALWEAAEYSLLWWFCGFLCGLAVALFVVVRL